MSVHRTKTGYVVRWRQGDRNRSRTFRKRDLALHFDLKLKDQRSMGGVDLLASERSFDEVVEEYWRTHHRSLSETTRRTQRAYLEKKILKRFSGYRLCDVNSSEIIDFRTELEEAGVGAPTIRKILYVLSGVFTEARQRLYMTHNPVDVVTKPPAGRTRLIQPFPPERVEKVRNWFLSRDDLEGATMVSVLAYSGPRPAEAHEKLTWADIGETSIIYRGDKTGNDRTTRLLSPLRDDLRALRASKGEVIGQVFGWSAVRFDEWRRGDRPGGFGQATKDVGIDLSRPYDLRHAMATLLAGEGKGIDYIARQLGHSVASCTTFYRHLIEDLDSPVDAEERILAARNKTTMKERAYG